MAFASAGDASSAPPELVSASSIPSGLVGRTVPSLAPIESGDSILGISPLLDTASFQVGSLGVPNSDAFLRGDVLAKLDERLYAAFDLLQVRIHLHALERTPNSHAVLYSASLPLWTPPDSDAQLLDPSHAQSHRPRLPATMPFEFRLTPDLPQCVHLPGSGVRYVLTAELLAARKQQPFDPSNLQMRKIVASVPVHPMRYLPPGPLKRLLSSDQEPDQVRGRPPAYSDEPCSPNHRISSSSAVMEDAVSFSSEPPRSAHESTFGVAETVHVPPGYGLSPHIWSARYPTAVHAQLARTLFRRGEPMRINVLIPPPPQGLATEKGLSLRSVEARLVRVITLTEPDNEEAVEATAPSATTSSAPPPGPDLGPSLTPGSGSGSVPVAAAPTPSSLAGKKQTVYEAQLSYSGKLARFNSSRAIVLRLALHSPYHIACPPGPSAEIDRALYDVKVSSGAPHEEQAAAPLPSHSGVTRSEMEAEANAAALADAHVAQSHQRENTACANISQETLFHTVEYEVRLRIALISTRSYSRFPSPECELTSTGEKKAQDSSAALDHAAAPSTSGNGWPPTGPPRSPPRAPGASEDRPRDVHIRFSKKVFILPGIPPEAGIGLNSDGNPLWTEDFVDATDLQSDAGEAQVPDERQGGEGSAPGPSTTHASQSIRAEKMRAAEALDGSEVEDDALGLSQGGRVFDGFDQLEEFDGYEDSIIYEEGGASSSATGPSSSGSSTGGALLGTGLGSGPVPPHPSLSTGDPPPTPWDAPPAEDDPPPVGADDDLNEFEVRMGIEIGRRIAAIGAEGPVPQWTPGDEDDDLRPPPGEPPEESEAHADAHVALVGAREEDPPPPMPQSPPAWTAALEPAPVSDAADGSSDVDGTSWDAPPASAPPPDENHPDPMGLRLAAAARQLSLNTSFLGQVRARTAGTRLHSDPPPSFGDATAPDAPMPPSQNFSYAYPVPVSLPASRRPSSQSIHSVLVHGLSPTLHPSSVNVGPPSLGAGHAPPPPPYRGNHEPEHDHHPGADPHRPVQPPSYSDAGGSLLAPAPTARSPSRPTETANSPRTASDDQELPTYAEYERQ